MKRNHQGAPVMMVHRWNRGPLSCGPCREKKRRCDRNRPCSNCILRNIRCEYGANRDSDELMNEEQLARQGSPSRSARAPLSASQSAPHNTQPPPSSLDSEEMLQRLQKLEEAVFDKSHQSILEPRLKLSTSEDPPRTEFTPFSACPSIPPASDYLNITSVARYLPPIREARELLNHFALGLHLMYGVLHIPYTQELMEQTYEQLSQHLDVEFSNLLLLLAVFAGAALTSSPPLLDKLGVTQAKAVEVSNTYVRLSMVILDSSRHIPPSTVALAALETLNHVIASSEGPTTKTHAIQVRRFQMARAMQIHRLDSAKSVEERRLKGCNYIELEMQRRIWWNMVSSDWLTSFAGGPLDGTYTFHPKQMKVNYPSNADDEDITKAGILRDFPLSTAIYTSGFILRLQMSSLCRQVVDAMPSTFLESGEPDYNIIMEFDEKFQNCLKELPVFYRLDPDSIRECEQICRDKPMIPFHRLNIHFSVHTRLCLLHRSYHLKGMTNPKYAYSNTMCVRSAQTVLELRRLMEDSGTKTGMKPARFWRIMQHVFVAALLLATDVAFNPNGAGAESRRAQVLSAYETLEKSDKEPGARMEGLRMNMQTLMLALQKQRAAVPSAQPRSVVVWAENPTQPQLSVGPNESPTENNAEAIGSMPAADAVPDENLAEYNAISSEVGTGEENWDSLWSEFLAVAPELDMPEWNSLLQEMDTYLNPDIS